MKVSIRRYKMIHHLEGFIPFWDDKLTDHRETTAVLSVNKPAKVESILQFDKPWEGNGINYFSMVHDDGKYRLYYESWSDFDPEWQEGINVCYAESSDGIHWEKPNLGVCEFRGSKDNNILMAQIPDNITVMLDKNPKCPPEQKYKAVMTVTDTTGFDGAPAEPIHHALGCLVSADGIHFSKFCLISVGYQYDSQNTLHWDEHTGKYYCYFRAFHPGTSEPDSTFQEESIRDIMVTESEDLLHWSEPEALQYGASEDYPLYTNCIMAYPYDTRYYIGWPTRYVERKDWTPNFDRLTGREKRKHRIETAEKRMGLTTTDCVFMSSRDRYHWHRFDEACITPGPENGRNWVYGDCYPVYNGLLETPGRFPGTPNELSIFVDENMWMGIPKELIRYVYRMDGFASYKAGYRWEKLITVPFTFTGDTLSVNFRTSARGSLYAEILDIRNNPIPGYKTCEIFGDSVNRILDFEKPLSALSGQTVRLRFTMRDAEIFAMRFSSDTK